MEYENFYQQTNVYLYETIFIIISTYFCTRNYLYYLLILFRLNLCAIIKLHVFYGFLTKWEIITKILKYIDKNNKL